MFMLIFAVLFLVCGISKIMRDRLFRELRQEFDMQDVSYVVMSDFLKEEWQKGNQKARLACLYDYVNIGSAMLAMLALFAQIG